LSIERREPSAIPEKMAKFMEMAEERRNMPKDTGGTRWSPPKVSIPGVTDQLPPAYDGNSRADNHVSKLHTEIKLDGKVIARFYNSGVAEYADEYGYLAGDAGMTKALAPTWPNSGWRAPKQPWDSKT
jgi:hypothetical protein